IFSVTSQVNSTQEMQAIFAGTISYVVYFTTVIQVASLVKAMRNSRGNCKIRDQ
ncbi:unnamed protein product, partial [Trichobilharzia szidati]